MDAKTGVRRKVAGRMRCAKRVLIAALAAAGGLGCVVRCGAQETQNPGMAKPEAPVAPEPKRSVKLKDRQSKVDHRFWDRENDWLFAGVGASRTLDYFSTLNMRRRGRQEILLTNDVVDDHAGFAAIEAAASGVSIGAAYLFHHYEHHKLERWVSIVHIGVTTFGGVRNYCLKTAHFSRASSSP